MSTAPEPSVNDLNPIVKQGVEIEPMFLIDTTGSMAAPNMLGSNVERRDVLKEAMGAIVARLAELDSQAAAEQAAAEDDDEGGVMTYSFADGGATKIGDLRPDNWESEWGKIRWGGYTEIMPGWTALQEGYVDEFGDRPVTDRPHLAAVIFTDGEARDSQAFEAQIAQTKGGTYVVIAVLGFGQEHDATLAEYQAIGAKNDHVRVVTFGNTTDPTEISQGTLSLLGQGSSVSP